MTTRESYKERKRREFQKKFPDTSWTFEDEWMLGIVNYDLHSFYLSCHSDTSEEVHKWLESLRARLGVTGEYFL